MNLSEPFVKRPVMTTMIMAGIFLFGVIAFQQLPISNLPSIEYPTITVFAQNPGSDPKKMANNVATPLEQQMMAIPGLKTIISQSSLGNTRLVLNFELNRSIDGAATDVMQAINAASGNLPPEMPSPPSYKKVNPSDSAVIYIAVSSQTMALDKLYDYASTGIAQRFSMIEGASQVQIYGSPRAIRVKLNPDKLAAMNLGIDSVTNAIVNANQSLPTGTVYDQQQAYTIISLGQLENAETYDKIIVAEKNNRPVYLSSIGKGVTSTQAEDYFLDFWDNTQKEETPTPSLSP